MRLFLAACAAASIVACAAVGAEEAATSPGTARLRGTYVRTVTKADIARTRSFRHEGPGQSPPPPGRVKLVLSAGTFRAVDFTGFAIAQTYSATASGRLTIVAYVNPGAGSFCGPVIPQNATYRWSVTGRTLTLRATDDRCADRDSVLTGRWTRIGN
jgi:hypothetical protein